MLIGTSVPDAHRVKVAGTIDPRVRGCRRLTLFDAIFDRHGDGAELLLTDQPAVIAHGIQPVESLFRCVELCAGIACSSTGLAEVGFRQVCSVEWHARLVDLHRSCHPGVPVIHGDICDPSCLKEVVQYVIEPPFTLMTGFSWQPYSSGGSLSGSCDERSTTVPATVNVLY